MNANTAIMPMITNPANASLYFLTSSPPKQNAAMNNVNMITKAPMAMYMSTFAFATITVPIAAATRPTALNATSPGCG